MPTISGRVFLDENGDNTELAAGGGSLDRGFGGVRVELFNRDQQQIAATQTSADGSYSFPNLPGFTGYAVRVETPFGFVPVRQFVGDDRFNSEADETGLTDPVIFRLLGGDSGRDVDIGLRPDSFSAEINGRAFYDTDGNLREGNGDVPAVNVTVALVNANGDVYDTTQTNEVGEYQFNSVGAGFNVVAFVAPFNGIPIAQNAAGDDVDSDINAQGQTEPFFVSEGQTVSNVDAGYSLGTGSISGRVFLDGNADNTELDGAGGFDQGVPPQDDGQRVVAVLYDQRGVPAAQTEVDDEGNYSFLNVIEGTYSVRFVSGFQLQAVTKGVGNSTVDSNIDQFGFTDTFQVGDGEDVTDIDAGYSFPGTGLILGRAFFDADGSRSETEADTDVEGVTVQLINDLGAVLGTTTTGPGGVYTFSGVGSGEYGVKFLGSIGLQSLGTTGGDPATNSDADEFGNVPLFAFAAGEQKLDLDIGYRPANGSISGQVFLDEDNNAVISGGDSPIAGMEVILLDAAGNVIDTTGVSASGSYSFTGVSSGTYALEFRAPFTLEAVAQGRDQSSTDSDIGTDFIVRDIVLGIDETRTDISAGFKNGTASISGRAFFDEDSDGTELALTTKVDKGVNTGAAILKRPDGEFLTVTPINDDGSYAFTGLGAGDYVVEFDTAEDTPITPLVGDPRFDSQIVTTTDPITGDTITATPAFFVSSGQNVTDFDAGFVGTRDTSLDIPPIRSFTLAENVDNLQSTSGQLSANAARAVELVTLENGALVMVVGSSQGSTNGIASYRLDNYENGPSYGEIIGTEVGSTNDIAARVGVAGDTGSGSSFQAGYTFVRDMASVTLDNGRSFVYSADNIFGGIGVTEVNANGSLRTEQRASVRDTDPVDLEVLEVGGQPYLVALGDGFSAPLAVYRIDPQNGRISEVDRARDGFGSNEVFLRASENSAALATYAADGASEGLVVAGGTDGGISLWTVGANGALTFQNARADNSAGSNGTDPQGNNLGRDLVDPGPTGLNAVDAAAMGELGGEIYVFVGGFERDVTIFRIDPDSRGDGTLDLTLVGQINDVMNGITSMAFVEEEDGATLVLGGDDNRLIFYDVDVNGNGTVSLNEATRIVDNNGQREMRDSSDIDVEGGILVSSSFDDNGVAIIAAGALPQQPPQARPDEAATFVGEAVTIDVLANDSSAQDLSLVSADVVAGAGSVTVQDGVLVFDPEDGFEGEAVITYVVADQDGLEATSTATITVEQRPNEAPVAVDDTAVLVITDETPDITIDVLANDTDAEDDALTITDATVAPEAGTVAIVDGQLLYTPAAGVPDGTVQISYAIEDAAGGTSSAVVDVAVSTPVNEAPIAVDDVASTGFGAAVSVAVLANDSDPEGGALTVTGASAPVSAGVAEVVGNEVVFTPADGFSGEVSVSYEISDPEGLTGTGVITVTVEPSDNEAPVARFDLLSVSGGVANSLDVVANDVDPDGDPLTLTDATVSPVQGSVEIVGNELVYTPADGFSGLAFITYEVSDPEGATDRTFLVAFVSPAPTNLAPEAEDDTATTEQGTAVTIDVLSNDEDPDGDALSITDVAVAPAVGTASVEGNQVRFDPADDFTGEAVLTYTVADPEGATDTATVTVTVEPAAPNQAPVARFEIVSATNDGPVSIDALANDSDPDGDPLTITEASVEDSAGTVEIVDNEVLYTPASDFTGVTLISYRIADPDGAEAGTFIAVNVSQGVSTNEAPVAVDDTAITVEGQEITLDLVGNDTDAEDSTLILAEVDTPPASEGTAAIQNNQLVFTPAAGFVGSLTLGYVVEDQDGATDTGEVVIIVDQAPNEAPVAVDDSADAIAGEPVTIDLVGNDTDAEDSALTLAQVATPPAGTGTAEIVDNILVFTPADDFSGEVTLGYIVTDSDGASDNGEVTITVEAPANEAPEAVDDTAATVAGQPVLVDVLSNDSDPENDPISVTDVSVDPAAGVAEIVDGAVFFAPAADFSGDAAITYTIEDSAQNSASATLTVAVEEVPQDDLFFAVEGAETLDGGSGNDYFVVTDAASGDGDVIIGGSGPDDTQDVDILDLRSLGGAQNLDVEFDTDFENDFGSIAGTITFLDATGAETAELTFSGIEALITDSNTAPFQAFFGGSRYAPSPSVGLPGATLDAIAAATLDDDGNTGSVLEIDSELENFFISQVLGGGETVFWLGLDDLDGDGTFTGANGALTDDDYQNWAPGQPDGSGPYTVLTENGTWDDVADADVIVPGLSPILLLEWDLGIVT